MSHFLSACLQVSRRVLLAFCLVCALCMTSLVGSQPAAAANSTQQVQPTPTQNASQATASNREAAYEALTETVNDPKGLEKEYEKNLDAFEETQPDKSLVEEARELVDKVTGNN